MDPKLEAIADKASELLRSSIREASDEITRSWAATWEEAEANERDPVLALSFSIRLDIGANRMTTALGFAVRHKFECAVEIPDPMQPELPMDQPQDSEQEQERSFGN